MRAHSSRGTAVPSSRSTLRRRAGGSSAAAGPRPPTSIVPSTSRAPVSSSISLRRDDLAVHRLLGREALLEAPGGLGAQRELRRRALEVRAVPVGRLHQHAGGRLAHLGALAAHQAGDRRRAVLVGDQQARSASSVRSTSSSVVILSPGAGAAHGEPAAGDEVEVERVQRLAREQHRVVGDVDDVVDRALAGGAQAGLQPRRRRADRHVLEQPGGEARAQLRVLDDDLARPRPPPGCRGRRPTAAGRAARRWRRGPRARRRRRSGSRAGSA